MKIIRLKPKFLAAIAILISIGSDIKPSSAQSPEVIRTPDRRLPLPETPLKLPSQDLLKPVAPLLPADEGLNVAGTIIVDRFEIIGNTVFSLTELTKATASFTKRPISFAELLQARAAITELYINRGYITSGALIPPQKLADGVVKIQVLEGSLEDIKVSGTTRLNPDYIKSRLRIATNQPLNRDRLIEGLQLLQLNPLIKNISAELSAGVRPGTNLLEVQVTEANSFNAQILLDNKRSPSVGTFRRQAQITEGNLFGQGDSIVATYINTDGSNAYDLSYTLPINPNNGTVQFSYNNSDSRIIEFPFDSLDIVSGSRSYEISLRQPLIQTPTQEFALGLIASHRQSDTALLGTPFPLSVGADQQGRTRVSVLRFFQEFTQRSSQQVLALRSQISVGLGLLDATINPNDLPDSRFVTWRGQGQYINLLAPDTLLLLRSDIQLADRALLPLEQFGLGGQDTIRGYRQDLLLSDNGITATAELRLPILRSPELQGLLQLAPFFDIGAGWNSSGRSNPSSNTIVGTGVGLRYTQGDRLTVRLDYGIPLVSGSTSRATWQENGVYFSLSYNLF